MPVNSEYLGKKIPFLREISGHQMSEVDLMLALNKTIQRVKEGLETRFCQIKYSSSGAIFTLFTEKANAGAVISRLSNVFI